MTRDIQDSVFPRGSATIALLFFGFQLAEATRVGDEDVLWASWSAPIDTSERTRLTHKIDDPDAYLHRHRGKSKHISAPRHGNAGIYHSGKTGLDDEWNRDGVYRGSRPLNEEVEAEAEDVLDEDEYIGDDDPNAEKGTWDSTFLIMKDKDFAEYMEAKMEGKEAEFLEREKELSVQRRDNTGKMGHNGVLDRLRVAKLYVFDPETMDSVTAGKNQLNYWMTPTAKQHGMRAPDEVERSGLAALWSKSKKSWYLLARSDKPKGAAKMRRFLRDVLHLH